MRALLLMCCLLMLCGSSALAAEPSGWTVVVNSATGKWAKTAGMTFDVPANLQADGSPAFSGAIDTGVNASVGEPNGFWLMVGRTNAPEVTYARFGSGFFVQCGHSFLNGGNHMLAGTCAGVDETGTVTMTVTPY